MKQHSASVSEIFPIVKKTEKGYVKKEVEEYLDEVKKAFYSNNSEDKFTITSASIRHKSFKLSKKGYDPRFVDAALDRLEDLFFDREKKQLIEAIGVEEWTSNLRKLLQEIKGRLDRPKNLRFRKASLLTHGYKRSQVDAILNQISEAMEQRVAINPNQIRQVRFHAQRQGYDEAQVDAFLDAVVVYFLSIKK